MTGEMNPPDFERGMGLLKLIGGRDFDGPINSLAAVSADMARLTVAFPYGQVLCRELLDLRTRQICTVSSLIAHGSAQSQLRFHMQGLLNAGGTPQDLVELMFLSTALIGFPTAINAIDIVRSIFNERSIVYRDPPSEPSSSDMDRYEAGLVAFERLMHLSPAAYVQALEALSPDMADWAMEFAFGEILGRSGMEVSHKQFAAISMLATCGNRQDQLAAHMRAALADGITVSRVAEVLIQLSVYAGFPMALNAFSVLATAIEEPTTPAVDSRRPRPATGPNEDRMARGEAALAASSGGSGAAVVNSFDDIAPDIGRMIVEHSYGDIFCRRGIDLKTRELTACAALAAKGTRTTEKPLRVHINAAVKAGASSEEIVETLLNLLPYCGYPTVQVALAIARDELAALDQH
ncbi:hypothetical protein PHLH8_13410 [Pseudomonas sp. Pc102]|nr:hypothetical protein PHLH8_13410 [Pseudomonas sp. Pc102]